MATDDTQEVTDAEVGDVEEVLPPPVPEDPGKVEPEIIPPAPEFFYADAQGNWLGVFTEEDAPAGAVAVDSMCPNSVYKWTGEKWEAPAAIRAVDVTGAQLGSFDAGTLPQGAIALPAGTPFPNHALDRWNGAGWDAYINYSAAATAALLVTDKVAARCSKFGVPFPPAWLTYTAALASIEKTNAGPLPPQPAYPAGTEYPS